MIFFIKKIEGLIFLHRPGPHNSQGRPWMHHSPTNLSNREINCPRFLNTYLPDGEKGRWVINCFGGKRYTPFKN